MKCPRCNTTDPKYFYKIGSKYYCRRCIGFNRTYVDSKLQAKDISFPKTNVYYSLDYSLSDRQKEIATQLIKNYNQGQDGVVLAVCGSGKTEIIYDILVEVLNKGGRVCLAIPRKSLVVELANRIQSQFKNIQPELFYGGYTGNLNGQLIICTTHQLYRFYQAFDLLILDETDAFPYYRQPLLNDLLKQSVRGNIVYMSATLTQDDFSNVGFYVLNRRYHQVDLPVPVFKTLPKFYWLIYIEKYIRKCTHPLLIFVPKIEDFKVFKVKFKNKKFACISSKTSNPHFYIQQLKEGQIDFIVTTTILERGVTIADVQVLVYNASHSVFNAETLIQIAGRVGRNPMFPSGEVIFISNFKSKAIKICIQRITQLNKMDV